MEVGPVPSGVPQLLEIWPPAASRQRRCSGEEHGEGRERAVDLLLGGLAVREEVDRGAPAQRAAAAQTNGRRVSRSLSRRKRRKSRRGRARANTHRGQKNCVPSLFSWGTCTATVKVGRERTSKGRGRSRCGRTSRTAPGRTGRRRTRGGLRRARGAGEQGGSERRRGARYVRSRLSSRFAGPASMTRTEVFGSSDSLVASTRPAV